MQWSEHRYGGQLPGFESGSDIISLRNQMVRMTQWDIFVLFWFVLVLILKTEEIKVLKHLQFFEIVYRWSPV